MDLINTFLYFSIFKHPLTKEEARLFCHYRTDSIDAELRELVDRKILFKIKGFYLPYDNPSWVERRVNGNRLAAKKMVKAKRMAAIMGYFPFVRCVMVSGSLSKGYMDEKSDIDFFVITHPGSIAISKTLMGLFRRFFAPKSFCVNFIVDSENLYIKKQNLYTAIELATLVPMTNKPLYDRFINENKEWVRKYLPNSLRKNFNLPPYKRKRFQVLAEWLCSNFVAKKLDEKIRNIYVRRLRKNAPKESHSSGEVIIEKGILKFHGRPYQKKIMQLYADYQKEFLVSSRPALNEHFYD